MPPSQMPSPSSLLVFKSINLVAYTLNTIVAFGIGVFGWFGLPNNGQVSQNYPTLVTPTGSTFSMIWSIIYIAEFVFVMVPFLVPRLISSNHLQQEATRWNFSIGVCLGQIAWTFAFANSIMWLAMLLLVVVLSSLIQIVQRQEEVAKEEEEERQQNNDDDIVVCCCPHYDYWLLRFPFLLHGGWIFVATLLQFNICLVVYCGNNEMLQYTFAILTLLGVGLVAFYQLLFSCGAKDATIPLVLAWASYGISEQLALHHPSSSDVILSTFTVEQIAWISQLATIVTILILVGIAVSIVGCRRRRGKQEHLHSNDAMRKDETLPILLG